MQFRSLFRVPAGDGFFLLGLKSEVGAWIGSLLELLLGPGAEKRRTIESYLGRLRSSGRYF